MQLLFGSLFDGVWNEMLGKIEREERVDMNDQA